MSRLRVKFCGVMSPDDARAAAEAGADAVGMILHADARRKIGASIAKSIVAALPPYVTPVGLFVNAPIETVLATAADIGLSTVQLHGDESPDYVATIPSLRVVKVLRVNPEIETALSTWRAALAGGRLPNLIGLLLDGAGGGGTGVANDFGKIGGLQRSGAFEGLPPVIIAGGLTPENVGEVVAALHPFAVDTSSGIEAEYGRKSPERMQAFIARANAAY